MNNNEYCELEDLRKKLLKLGIGYSIIGKKGEKGDKGDAGPLISSSTEGIFFTTFNDSKEENKLTFDTPWLVPNPSTHFSMYDNDIELEQGLYEISLSGSITNVDNDHSGTISVITKENEEIKGLSFELEQGNIPKIYFSRTILFRFEKPTVLEVHSYINGDINTSNITFSDINLYIKKIHE